MQKRPTVTRDYAGLITGELVRRRDDLESVLSNMYGAALTIRLPSTSVRDAFCLQRLDLDDPNDDWHGYLNANTVDDLLNRL